MAERIIAPCMFDNQGRREARWLPHMQSPEFLRQSIARGVRTDECWAELKDRQQRVRAAMEALQGKDGVGGPLAGQRQEGGE